GCRPARQSGTLCGVLRCVEELLVPRIEVELDGHALPGHDPVERVERREAGGVQLYAGQRLSVLHLKAREPAGEPAPVELEDRMLDHLHVIWPVLALPVEEERLVE